MKAYTQQIIKVFLLTLALLLSVSCGGGTTTSSRPGTSGSSDPMARQQYGGTYSNRHASGDTQAGNQFAQWVLDQDPQHKYMTDAVMRNDSVLGIKISRTATKGDIDKLMRALLESMARTFPNRQLTVNAFYESGDKLAEARYNPTTNQVSVQFAQ